MTREDIINLARECGHWSGQTIEMNDVGLERFAWLVAAAQRNRTWTQDHWTDYERSIAAAAKAEENEACAKVCEERHKVFEKYYTKSLAAMCAEAIRARKGNE